MEDDKKLTLESRVWWWGPGGNPKRGVIIALMRNDKVLVLSGGRKIGVDMAKLRLDEK